MYNRKVFWFRTGWRSFIILAFGIISCTLSAQDIEQLPKQKPFEIHGSLSAGAGYYVSSAAFGNTRKPYNYFINASPVISLYGIQIPINFTMTEGSQHLTNPFAQFGINPYWKWIKLYGGWTNMTWSPTTLNGKTFLGCGIELNPSLFRFGAMYGRFNPAVKEDTTKFSVTPQYKRRGFAFKIGVGNEKNYFDFIFLKAKDVQGSIPQVKDYLNYPAQENAVFGIISHQSFLKQKLVWNLDAAVSAYTRDLNSQLLDIGTGTGTKFLKTVIPPRLSTSYAWTAHTNFTYRNEKMTLGLDYNRVQPEYVSMGVDYLMNDQEKYMLTQSFNLAKNKVILSLNEFYQRDDLNKRKAVKTNRISFNSTVALNLNQNFGMAVSYTNFSVFQQSGLKQLNDSTKLMQIQNMIAITPHYLIISEKLMQNIFAAVTYQRLDDLNDFMAQYTRNNTVNTNIGYTASWSKTFFTFSPSLNILYSKTPSFELLNIGPTVSASKSFWKGKISTSATITFTAGRQNKAWNNKTINNFLSVGYRIDNHHSLKMGNSITKTYFAVGSTSEYKGDLSYTYSF